MSYHHESQEAGRPIRVVDAAPALEVPEYIPTGKRGIPVFISPMEGAGGAVGSDIRRAPFEGFIILKEEENKDDMRKKWFKEMRGWLMVLATLAASVTYQAGLNPPGGFWQDTTQSGSGAPSPQPSHLAGDPEMQISHHQRYLIFYYFNATAFVTSLVIMVLLMSERFYHTEAKVITLMFTTVVDLVSLIGAYIAGTTRFTTSCIYIIVITFVSFVSVIYIGEVMELICYYILKKWRCFRNLAKKNWCPVPADVVNAALPPQERREKKRRPRVKQCLCSPCGAFAAAPPTYQERGAEFA